MYSIFTSYLNNNALAKVIEVIFRGYRDQYINTIDSNRNAGELGKFWLTFIDMATNLYSTINDTQKGNCDEFPRAYESLRYMIPLTFAHDRKFAMQDI